MSYGAKVRGGAAVLLQTRSGHLPAAQHFQERKDNVAFPKSKRSEFEKQAAQLMGAAHRDAFMAAMQRLPEHAKKAVELLDKFVEVYGETPLGGSMIEPGLKLWRDYYEWTGDHMVLTEEGWERAKDIEASDEEIEIFDEVNAPAK